MRTWAHGEEISAVDCYAPHDNAPIAGRETLGPPSSDGTSLAPSTVWPIDGGGNLLIIQGSQHQSFIIAVSRTSHADTEGT
jgi:hypothetical protein